MGIKRLSTSERIALAEQARTEGVSFAARAHNVSRNSAYHWLEKYRKTGISDFSSSNIISETERKTIIRLAKKKGISTIKEFIRVNAIKYSFTSVYNILSSSKIPVGSPKIIIYSCSVCANRFKALHLYIGKANAPDCPTCQTELRIKNGWKLRFLGSVEDYFLTHEGKLEKVSNADFRLIRESLKPPESFFPKYVDSTNENNAMITHILSGSSEQYYFTLCRTNRINAPAGIYSACSGSLDSDRLCGECVEEANFLLSEGNKLEPKFSIARLKKKDNVENAIELAEITKNIAEACRIYNISRNTFYKYKPLKSNRVKPLANRPSSRSITISLD